MRTYTQEENIITSAVQIPGVKVSRDKFLAETFATEDVIIQDVLDFGPVEAKVSKEKLHGNPYSDVVVRIISSKQEYAKGIKTEYEFGTFSYTSLTTSQSGDQFQQ